MTCTTTLLDAVCLIIPVCDALHSHVMNVQIFLRLFQIFMAFSAACLSAVCKKPGGGADE